jgi:hypothetical protein
VAAPLVVRAHPELAAAKADRVARGGVVAAEHDGVRSMERELPVVLAEQFQRIPQGSAGVCREVAVPKQRVARAKAPVQGIY